MATTLGGGFGCLALAAVHVLVRWPGQSKAGHHVASLQVASLGAHFKWCLCCA